MRASVSSFCAARSASARGPRVRASIVARRGVPLLRGERLLFSRAQRPAELGDSLGARLALGLLEARAAQRGALALDAGAFRLEAREAAPFLAEPRQRARGDAR